VAKRLALLHELLPRATRVAVLVNPSNVATAESTVRDVAIVGRAPSLDINLKTAKACSRLPFHQRFSPAPTRSFEEQDQRPVMQRAGTLRYVGPPRPGPLLNRPLGDKCCNPGKPSQANRGPKNRGRSSRLRLSNYRLLGAKIDCWAEN
jgi:hypothetical protein